jgi:hypothetical protein
MKSRTSRTWMALATITGLAGLAAAVLTQAMQDRLSKEGPPRMEEDGRDRPLAGSFHH